MTRKKRVLIALKLSSDSLMAAEAIALKNTSNIDELFLLTDKKYRTEIKAVKYYYLKPWVAKIPILRVFARIPAMIGICRSENIDILICYHLTSYGFAGFVVSLLLKIPMSMHFLGKDIDELCQKPLLGALLLKLASKINILTVQGTNSKRFLQRKGFDKIYIIPTACDLNKFYFNNALKEYDIIFLGRLSREKRIDRYIDIIKIIRKKNYTIRAVIVGTGPEEQRMLTQIKNYDLENCIDYIGWTEDVVRYLSRSRIFVLTSDSDQLPSSLLEAMAMGLVPVVSDVGNISDVVNEKSGFIINKDNIQEFVDAIIHLLKNDEVYSNKSKEAQKKVREFSIEENSKRWGAILDCWSNNNEK